MLNAAVAVLLLIAAAIAMACLVSGADFLEWLLPGALPLGNAIAAALLCALAGAALALSRHGTVLRTVTLVSFFAAVGWLPVSIALAGNAALNFHDGHGRAWLIMSAVVAGGAMYVLAWALLAALRDGTRR